MVRPHELAKKGGEWLGAARNWLQWNTNDGDRILWGSHMVIEPQMTVIKFEDAAAEIASAAINEYHEKMQAILRRAKKVLDTVETDNKYDYLYLAAKFVSRDIENLLGDGLQDNQDEIDRDIVEHEKAIENNPSHVASGIQSE